MCLGGEQTPARSAMCPWPSAPPARRFAGAVSPAARRRRARNLARRDAAGARHGGSHPPPRTAAPGANYAACAGTSRPTPSPPAVAGSGTGTLVAALMTVEALLAASCNDFELRCA